MGYTRPRRLDTLPTGDTLFWEALGTFGSWMGAMTASGIWKIPAMVIYAVTGSKFHYDLKKLEERKQLDWFDGMIEALSYIRDNQEKTAACERR